MNRRPWHVTRLLSLVAATLTVASCEDIVYRDRALFDDPVEGATGFLGYADAAQGRTVCGQCHVSYQRHWEGTAHAGAWTTLATSVGEDVSCRACHTTNALGNTIEGAVGGYFAQPDSRYHDVQCESCHGPGLDHVRTPTRDTWPLASLAVGTDLSSGCGECHTGDHQPFVEQWASSRHANVRASPAGNPSCSSCHRGQDVLRSWGVRSEYQEKNATEHLPIGCGVCHDPHDATNPKQLRMPIDVASEEENLCMQCHHKRGTPDPTTFRGPHSPEGPVLLGFGGWWPPNLELQPGQLVATHGSEANPRLCAGCHVNQWEKRDGLTGQLIFRATGHTFEAIPCADAEGIPTGSRECDLAERTFRTCAQAGCHGTEAVARTLITVVRDRLHTLADALQAMEALVPAAEYDPADTRYTTAEGARFNRELAQFRGSEIHNPWLIEALLRGSIRQLQLDYGLAPPAGINLEQELGVH
jgi:predicted CXXCH cytochrome family protein